MRNAVLTFLLQNKDRLGLEEFGAADRFTSVIATPRFKASSHLIFFVFPENVKKPVLIAKVPRLAGDHSRLCRERNNLKALQELLPKDLSSAPRVVAFEDYFGHRMLIETAVAGQTMRPAFVRQNLELAIETGVNWLTSVHNCSRKMPQNQTSWFKSSVQKPLQLLQALTFDSERDRVCLEKTLEIADALVRQTVPTVFEHGDFSSPNLLISAENRLGVVDWELALPDGLPAVDLFFFLSYIAFARMNANNLDEQMAAFRAAFFGANSWATASIGNYLEELKLSAESARALFVICWARYVSTLVLRLGGTRGSGAILPAETLSWIRENRYYKMWRMAVAEFDNIQCCS